MSDEELKQNVSDEVLGVVENMWSAVKNMEGEPKVCRAVLEEREFDAAFARFRRLAEH